MISDTVRGLLGVGVTLLVFGSAMATVNGLARGFAARRLAEDPDNEWAQAIILLF